MGSLRIHSHVDQSKTLKSKYSLGKRYTCTERPTPLDFDSFIPWLCLELRISKIVIVRRTNQAEYVPYGSKLSKDTTTKSSKLRSRSTRIRFSTTKSNIACKKTSATLPTSKFTTISFPSSTINIEDVVPVTSCYDKHGRLIEIAIVGCPFPIPRKVIQAFNICLPFHSALFKFSILKGGLCETVLYEISKLLPHSNITDICLDDSNVTEGNYSILLSRPSQIKYLSLKRCGIKDKECINIAAKINIKGPAVNTLLLLDLTSNEISDEGAHALGESLKYNRHLQYLNLSGNNLSDAGASGILDYLIEFHLNFDDIKQKRGRKLDYLSLRSLTYAKCLEEAKLARVVSKSKRESNTSSDQIHSIVTVSKQSRHEKRNKNVVPSFIFEESSVEEDAEKKTNDIVGEFQDPFKDEYIHFKGDLLYAIGNLSLLCLNLAYNNLTLLSIRKILKILKYQSEINTLTPSAGLVRVVIDGNNIPTNCNELHEIDIYLKKALLQKEHFYSRF